MVYIVYAMYAVYRSLPPVVWGGGGPESLPRTPPYHWGGGGPWSRITGSYIYIYTMIYIYRYTYKMKFKKETTWYIYIHTHTHLKFKYLFILFIWIEWLESTWGCCWALRLRSQISSFLDVPGLCAERATAPQSSSRKAPWSCALLNFDFVELSGSGPGFCCSTCAAYSTWNATHSDGGNSESAALSSKKQLFARPAVLMALADIHTDPKLEDQIPQLEQALARDCFQVFAGVQGVCNQWYVGNTDVGVSCIM